MRQQNTIASFCTAISIENIHVNQKDLHLDANALEDADMFDGFLPAPQEVTSDEEIEE